ncbi:MAG: aminomethyl-transferring glycine dehydrogenase subunit GcvPA [Acidobacteriota bacterium]
MHRYIPLTETEKQQMLRAVGVSSMEDLFASIPASLRLKRPLCLPEPLGELDVERRMTELERQNVEPRLCFLGAGAYYHHIPAHVGQLASRSEFLTAYTPYQPEVSQGTLQAIFEFQTMICQLTGLDVANASMYDGASATAEAMLMANRANGRGTFLLARSLHPEYRQVCRTYAANLGFKLVETGSTPQGTTDLDAAAATAGPDLAAIIMQSPNFFGCLEDWSAASALAKKHGALSIAVVAEPLSLAIAKSPGECGCDIAVGEAQSFGVPISFGGPYLGFMAALDKHVRNMPGRLVGQTVDRNGRRGFVLTLATREQHIRREKATSNICTNEGLCALMATIYLATLGRHGLRDLAVLNLSLASYARKTIAASKTLRLRFHAAGFNELVVELRGPAAPAHRKLLDKGIVAGLPLGGFYPELSRCLLLYVQETTRKEDIDELVHELDGLDS